MAGVLAGKRALVTGGSRGIGKGIALALAAEGAAVVLTYVSNPDAATAVVKEIEGKGGRAVAIAADSADPAAVKRSVDEAAAALGGLDILVNNAGIARINPLDAQPLEEIDAQINVNFRGVVVASQAALAHLQEGGRIITIGSNAGRRVPNFGITVYAATKAALTAFTQGLSREVGLRGITVNLIEPGPIATDMNPDDGEFADAIRPLIATGQYGQAEDVAAATVFLASPAAKQITGAALLIDGGMNA